MTFADDILEAAGSEHIEAIAVGDFGGMLSGQISQLLFQRMVPASEHDQLSW